MSCSDPACFYGRRGLGQYTRQLEVCVDRCEKNRHFGFFHSWLPEPASCSGTWTRLDKALCMDINNNVCKGLSTLVPGRKHFPGHTAGSCVFWSREEAGLSHVGFPGEGLVCAPVMMGEQAIVEGLCQGCVGSIQRVTSIAGPHASTSDTQVCVYFIYCTKLWILKDILPGEELVCACVASGGHKYCART